MPRKPRVLNDEELAQVEALASLLTVEQLADYFGIGRRTFYDIMNRQEDVAARYKKGRAKMIGNLAKNLINKANDGDTACLIFALKTIGGWKETNVVETAEKKKTFADMYNDANTES
jgi:hypothetical protein